MKSTSAFLLSVASIAATLVDGSVTLQRDGTAVTSEWSISCAAVDQPTMATFSVELKTQSPFSTYAVEITSKFESASVASSEEAFGDVQITTGGGDLFSGLAVGELHELPIGYTYLTTGSRMVELTATIKTGNWAWPDREKFTETISVLIEEDGCSSPYEGPPIGSSSGEVESSVAGSARAESAASMPIVSLITVLGSIVAYFGL